MKRIVIAMLLLFLLQPAAFHAASLGEDFSNLVCVPLFGGSSIGSSIVGNTIAVSTPSTYSNILDFSLLIILLVLVVLGIIYAIGYSMKIDKLLNYSKTELLESVFNVIIIAAIAGGMILVFSGISFITSIANAGLSSAQSAINSLGGTTVSFSTIQVKNAHDLYVGICDNYGSSLMGITYNLFDLYALGLLQMFAQGFKIELMPNSGGFLMLTPGVTLAPLAGLSPSMQVISYFFTMVSAFAAILIGIPLLLFFIYYLFPFFLYAGILFRSFPWTRAAGGTLLALFISFYVVFPSLIYPFSVLSTTSIGNAYTTPTASSGSQIINYKLIGGRFVMPIISSGSLNINTWGQLGSLINLGPMILGYVEGLSGVILQVIGLMMALVISYDLVEMFGKLLGAPSVSARKMLSKVV